MIIIVRHTAIDSQLHQTLHFMTQKTIFTPYPPPPIGHVP